MPAVRKLDQEEVAKHHTGNARVRARIEREYDDYLADFGAGDYGEAQLLEGERKAAIKKRLTAAAERKVLTMSFFRTSGKIIRFKLEAVSLDEAIYWPARLYQSVIAA